MAYAAVDRHRLDDYKPYIYRTNDGGATWKPISNGIPAGSFVNAVREDPVRSGLLYAGTERGVYVSFDDGANWQPLQLNLPVTSVRDIAVHGNDLVLATHGRAFWVMDDIAPLRQIAQAPRDQSYLFAPVTAYRVRPGNQEGTPLPLDEPQADNAPTGLYIDYYLPHDAHGPVVIEILAGDGSVVRRWSSSRAAQSGRSAIRSLHDALDRAPCRSPDGCRSASLRLGLPSGHLRRPAAPAGGLYGQAAVSTERSTRATHASSEIRGSPQATRTSPRSTCSRAASKPCGPRSRNRARRPKNSPSESRRERARTIRSEVAGQAPPVNPDDSMGAYSHDVTSFLFLENQLDYLESSVESADAAPTPDMRTGYDRLAAIYKQTLAKFEAISK